MRCHFIEGEAGCRHAVEHGCVAIVVDALRASATAAMLLHAGARELIVVREVEEARAAKAAFPDALLFGERGGLPPEGFDGGNSPRDAARAKDRTVIFTTTTGAGRLVSAWGAAAVYLGTTVNAHAVIRAAKAHDRDVVLIPAGKSGDPEFDAQEDRAAAAWLGMLAQMEMGAGAAEFDHWRKRIAAEGLEALFASAPHADRLREIGHDVDIAYCAQADLTDAVPQGIARAGAGIRVHRAPDTD